MKKLQKALVLLLVVATMFSLSLPAAAAIKYSKVKVYLNLKLLEDARVVMVGEQFYIAVDDFNKILPNSGIAIAGKYIVILRKKNGGEDAANIWMAFEPGTKTFYWNPDGKQIHKKENHLDVEPFVVDKQYMINLGIICNAAKIPFFYEKKTNALHLGQEYIDKKRKELDKESEKLAKRVDDYNKKTAEQNKKNLEEYNKRKAELDKQQAEADKKQAEAAKKAALERGRNYTRSDWTKATTSKKRTIASEVSAYLNSTGTKVSTDDVYAAIELALDLSSSKSLLALAKIGLKF